MKWRIFFPWDVLSLGTFCPLGRFVLGTFCPWDVLSLGPYVWGRFVLGRLVPWDVLSWDVLSVHRTLTYRYRYSILGTIHCPFNAGVHGSVSGSYSSPSHLLKTLHLYAYFTFPLSVLVMPSTHTFALFWFFCPVRTFLLYQFWWRSSDQFCWTTPNKSDLWTPKSVVTFWLYSSLVSSTVAEPPGALLRNSPEPRFFGWSRT